MQVLEATAAAVLAAAIIATAGGVGWLIAALPNKLEQMQKQIDTIIKNQGDFGEQFSELRNQVIDHDRRIIKLELK